MTKMTTTGLVVALAIAATTTAATLTGSARTIPSSPESAQRRGCLPGEQVQPDGRCVYDPAKRSVCEAGDRILPDGTCVHPDGGVTYQNVCKPGEQTLQDPLRCAYAPYNPAGQCLPGERLLPDGSCGGGVCRPGDQAQPDGTCVFDPTRRSVCEAGDRILPDGTCVHPDGGVTYQNVCQPGEQTLQNPLRCAYRAASPARSTTGCLVGEQLLPDWTCAVMVSTGCNAGEQIVGEELSRQFDDKVNLAGWCAYKVTLEGGTNRAISITCKPGERKFTSAALCAYAPAMVPRSTGFHPYQPRPR